jgi:hypothetical protein
MSLVYSFCIHGQKERYLYPHFIITEHTILEYSYFFLLDGRLCELVGRVFGYRSGGPGSIPGTTRFSGERKKKRKTVVGLERGPLSLVSTTEELLDRKVAAPL